MIAALAAWGGVGVEGPLGGGARSRLLRVWLEGRACVARRVGMGEPEARWLLRVLGAAEAAGVAVALPIAARNGQLVVGGWMLEPFIAGTPGKTGDLSALVPAFRRFQARTAGLPQRPGRGIGRSGVPGPLMSRIRRAWPDGRMVAVHGDLHPGNVIRSLDGRLTVIDWEEARRDAAGVDLWALAAWHRASKAHAAVEVTACWRQEPARGRAMARRLRAMGGGNAPVSGLNLPS